MSATGINTELSIIAGLIFWEGGGRGVESDINIIVMCYLLFACRVGGGTVDKKGSFETKVCILLQGHSRFFKGEGGRSFVWKTTIIDILKRGKTAVCGGGVWKRLLGTGNKQY